MGEIFRFFSFADFLFVKSPPAKAGGFGLRLKAGLIGCITDCLPLPKLGEGWGEGLFSNIMQTTPHPGLLPKGEGVKLIYRLKAWDFKSPIRYFKPCVYSP